jgi:spore germination protein YaaH
MTDITELAQREKFEAWAEECNALPWGYLKKRRIYTGFYSEHTYTSLWAAWKAAGAELVEALEKAQQRIAELEDAEQKLCAANVTLDARAELAERQLKSRTVTVKLSKDHVDDADPFGWGVIVVPLEALKEACADAGVTVEITDAGIKWETE